MFQDVIDALVIGLMFVLRIGVPIALTLVVGYWLEKKLAPAQQVSSRARTTGSAKIIPLHCWDVKKCTSTQRAQCAAYRRPDLPCWLALQAAGEKVRPECHTCAFYKPERIAA